MHEVLDFLYFEASECFKFLNYCRHLLSVAFFHSNKTCFRAQICPLNFRALECFLPLFLSLDSYVDWSLTQRLEDQSNNCPDWIEGRIGFRFGVHSHPITVLH